MDPLSQGSGGGLCSAPRGWGRVQKQTFVRYNIFSDIAHGLRGTNQTVPPQRRGEHINDVNTGSQRPDHRGTSQDRPGAGTARDNDRALCRDAGRAGSPGRAGGVRRGAAAEPERLGLWAAPASADDGRRAPGRVLSDPRSGAGYRRAGLVVFDLPAGAQIVGDETFNHNAIEDDLAAVGIRLCPLRTENSKRAIPPWETYRRERYRKYSETTGSPLMQRFPKTIHAVTAAEFELKIVLFLLAHRIAALQVATSVNIVNRRTTLSLVTYL
ncbi:MAG: hypothetical protein KatS3mg057_0505 [Herpetosiphonaceae bacterium]|nr:MAG: hypothetical protein KatS3mg057_0505 [Herpetosiphonaceae bacterium]